MGRKPREQEAGGVYHVYARANRGALLFVDDADRRAYLVLLGRVVARQEWRCLSYCLMPNHLHLLIQLTEPDLAVGMHWLHSVYARAFNARHGHDGHTFQSRYGSVAVRTDEQLVTVVGYIAHNPVKAGLAAQAGQWPWSSHAATVGSAARPSWLDVDRLLELLRAWGGDPRASYRELVGARGGEGRAGAGGRGVTVSTSLVNVGGGGPPKAPEASVVRKR
jgi:putative transposase